MHLRRLDLIIVYFIRNRHQIEADLLNDAILLKSKELHSEQLSDNLFNRFFGRQVTRLGAKIEPMFSPNRILKIERDELQ